MTVDSYVAHLKEQGRATATIKRALTAIRHAHRTHGFAAPERPVALAPPPPARSGAGKARPLQLEELLNLIRRLDPDTPAGLRDRALFLLGFFNSARPRELLLLDIDHPIHAPGPGAAPPFVLSALPIRAELCPLTAVREWKHRLAAQGIHEGPLFRRIDRHGRIFGGDRALAGRSAGDGGRLGVRGYNAVVRARGAQAGLDLHGLSAASLSIARPARGARGSHRAHAAAHDCLPVLTGEWRPVAAEHQLARRLAGLPRSEPPSPASGGSA